MKTLFSNIVVTLLLLLVAHTVSAIPSSATEADYSALSTQPSSSQYTGSSFHSAFRSIRNFAERNVVVDVANEAILVGAGDSLEAVPVPVSVPVTTVHDLSSEREAVNVPEPSLLALIAIGLVAVGFVHRRQNIK